MEPGELEEHQSGTQSLVHSLKGGGLELSFDFLDSYGFNVKVSKQKSTLPTKMYLTLANKKVLYPLLSLFQHIVWLITL